MLYDPKWEQKTDRVYERVSLRAFIHWLEQQDPDKTYDYARPTECAVAVFIQQTTGCTPYESIVDFGLPGTYLEKPEAAWLIDIVNKSPELMTFGAALDRAKKLAFGHV